MKKLLSILLIGCLYGCEEDSLKLEDSPKKLAENLVDATSIVVSTFAGTGENGHRNGPALQARFSYTIGIESIQNGTLFIVDQGLAGRIRKISPDNIVSDEACVTLTANSGNLEDVAITTNGTLYVSDRLGSKIYKVLPNGRVSVFAGGERGFADGEGTEARFYGPSGIAQAPDGNLFVADINNYKIRKITPEGVVTTFAGSGQGYDDGVGSNAKFYSPRGIEIGSDGNIYVTDLHRIRKITPAGVVSTLAGDGPGDVDGSITNARFNYLVHITSSPDGNLYVADQNNHKVKVISPAGVVTTIAGTGFGYLDGAGDIAKFQSPFGIEYYNNALYVSEVYAGRIRKIALN